MKIKVKNIFGNKPKSDKKESSVQFKKIINDKEKTLKINRNVNTLKNKRVNIKKIYSTQESKKVETQIDDSIKSEKAYTRNGAKSNSKSKPKEVHESKVKLHFDNLFKNKNKLSKSYYFLLVAMIVLGGGSVYFASKTYNLFNKEDYNVYASTNDIQDVTVSSSIDNGSANVGNKNEIVVNNTNTQTNETPKTEQTNKVETKPKEVVKVQPLSFSKPLQGDIIKMYSIDKVIYSKTLELWKTHDGIDVKADIGQSVKSIEKGIIEKVYDDSFYGTTIVIDHGQGYKSSYSNLEKNVSVKAKQSIKKGQVIGKVSNTSIGEIKDESHLHFMLYKDNKIVDPSDIFN